MVLAVPFAARGELYQCRGLEEWVNGWESVEPEALIS